MWKADGTFKSAPKGHTQLYTIHARHTRGETVPALYAVMVRKTKSNYRKLFRWLNAELEDENGSIGALQTVLIDFEPALAVIIWPQHRERVRKFDNSLKRHFFYVILLFLNFCHRLRQFFYIFWL